MSKNFGSRFGAWTPIQNDEITFTIKQALVGIFAVQALLICLIGIEHLGVSVSLLRPFIAIVYLTFMPGMLVAFLFNLEKQPFATFISYTIGISLMFIMGVAGISSLLYPLFGIDRPLTEIPFLITIVSVVTAIWGVTWSKRDTGSISLSISGFVSPFPLFLSLLPLLSILGTALLQVYKSNSLLLIILVAISLLPLFVTWKRSQAQSKWLALATWTVALALVYHGKLWPFLGGHQSAEITLQQGRWIPGVESLLANSVLFPVYALLADIAIAIEWNVVNPFLVSFLPVILFESFRRYISPAQSFVVVCFFMFSFPYYVLYPGAGRVATPVFFLALLALVLSDRDLMNVSRTFLALIFAIGVSVSHYGTAYVVMFAFLIGGVVYLGLNLVDELREQELLPSFGSRYLTDGSSEQTERKLLTLPFLGFYTIFALSWYLYTAEAVKFKILPRKVRGAVQGVLFGDLSGSAAGAVSRDYIGVSITFSKYIYIIIGGLIGIGLVVVLFRRLFYRHSPVEDEYLAVATGFIVMLGGSFLPAGSGFNIARVMMIVFTFTIPFILFGSGAISKFVHSLATKFRTSQNQPIHIRSPAVAPVLLSIFLLLNTGAVSAAITHDVAPSNSVNRGQLLKSEDPSERLRVRKCVECNIETHAWIMNHDRKDTQTYGDRLTTVQIDFYRGPITEAVGYVPKNGFYRGIQSPRNNTNGSSYLVLMPHNLDTNGYTEGYKFDWHRFNRSAYSFKQTDKIYNAGSSIIYRNSTGQVNVTDEQRD